MRRRRGGLPKQDVDQVRGGAGEKAGEGCCQPLVCNVVGKLDQSQGHLLRQNIIGPTHTHT